MSKVRLKRARVVAVVGQLKAASVTEHVSMRLDAQIGYDGCPFNHAAKSWRRVNADSSGSKITAGHKAPKLDQTYWCMTPFRCRRI